MKLTQDQLQAIDPKASVWVSASAGSGKTLTLINRIIRLLMDGAKPENLLCITYTNIAAAEMTNRLMKTLSDWSVLNNDDLTARLADIGCQSSKDHRNLARSLFFTVLNSNVKIQTIHSFCKSILFQ